MTSKTNSETNKKMFSIYITNSNEKEASFAILAVDSLLIEEKLIRAFFETTKYCNYFLNNSFFPNEDKSMFLYKLVKDKDNIIDSDMIFSYNEHLNLAKRIIQFSNPEETKKIISSLSNPKKTVFPNVDFLFLSEEQKEHYLYFTGISYVKSNLNSQEINKHYFNNDNYSLIKDYHNNSINKNYECNLHNCLIKN